MILGQKKLVNKISNLNLDTCPRSIMLIGQEGSGRHELVQLLGEKLGLEVVDITENISLETIFQIQGNPNPSIYLINGLELTVKEENCVLKFLEEPTQNAYIVFLTEDAGLCLSTIRSRCIQWELEPYSISELKKENIYSDLPDYYFDIFRTPGQLDSARDLPINDMVALANKILDKIGNANLSNTLTLTRFFAFKKNNTDENLYDIRIFLKVLLYCANKALIENRLVNPSMYFLTSEFIQKCAVKNVDYKYAFENYLVQLRMLVRKGAN